MYGLVINLVLCQAKSLRICEYMEVEIVTRNNISCTESYSPNTRTSLVRIPQSLMPNPPPHQLFEISLIHRIWCIHDLYNPTAYSSCNNPDDGRLYRPFPSSLEFSPQLTAFGTWRVWRDTPTLEGTDKEEHDDADYKSGPEGFCAIYADVGNHWYSS